MDDGNFEFYTIQHLWVSESPWTKPDEPQVLCEDKEWAFSSWDWLGHVLEPWEGSGNDYRPKHKKAHDETHLCRVSTGYHGWFSLKYAMKGLRRLLKGLEKKDTNRS